MIEGPVEKEVVRFAESRGWYVKKLKFIGVTGAPDRIFIRNSHVIFVEFKRPTKDATLQQARRHNELRAAGATVWVINDIDKGKHLFA